MTEQLTFDLPLREALGREAFFVSPSNAVALATVDTAHLWPSRKLVLTGPSGSGKTHMAHVWAADCNAVIVGAQTLIDADIPGLASKRNIVIEDADRLDDTPQSLAVEHALFHLHNLTLAEGGHLLITARSAPIHWKTRLPDLASRMQGTSIANIDPPDDMLLCAMLLKQFDDRQIAISHSLIPYLVKRMERSTANLRDIVETLDAMALREGKPISKAMAAQVINETDT
jgi:chromosomal replication initiation ATPase DnaA